MQEISRLEFNDRTVKVTPYRGFAYKLRPLCFWTVIVNIIIGLFVFILVRDDIKELYLSALFVLSIGPFIFWRCTLSKNEKAEMPVTILFFDEYMIIQYHYFPVFDKYDNTSISYTEDNVKYSDIHELKVNERMGRLEIFTDFGTVRFMYDESGNLQDRVDTKGFYKKGVINFYPMDISIDAILDELCYYSRYDRQKVAVYAKK